MRRILACLLLALLPLALAACGGQEGEGGAEGAEAVQAASEAAVHADGELVWQRYADGMELAGSEGKIALVDFWTSWCHWCKVMDKDTYSDEGVQRRLAESFVAIKVNAESDEAQGPAGSATGRDIAQEYRVNSYPTTWFVDAEGQKITPLPGFVPPEQFVVILDYISSGAYRDQDFQAFQASQGNEPED